MCEMIWGKGGLIVTRVIAKCDACPRTTTGKRFTGPEGQITICDYCNIEYGVQLMARLDARNAPSTKKRDN